MADLSTVAGRLAFARSRSGLRQKDAAARIDAHPVQISEWETGKYTPRPETLAALAALYETPVKWLLTGEGESTVSESPVPRGTYGNAATPPMLVREGASPHARRMDRIRKFEHEMVRLGADEFELDHVHVRARSFVESVLSHGGTEVKDEDLDEEFEAYLEFNLRPWVAKRIEERKKEERRAATRRRRED